MVEWFKKLISKLNRRRKFINKPRILLIITIIGLSLILVIGSYMESRPTNSDLEWNEFMAMAEEGKIVSIQIVNNNNSIYAVDIDGNQWTIINPKYDEMVKDLLEMGIHIQMFKTTFKTEFMSMLVTLPVMIAMCILIYYMMNTMVGSSTNMFSVLKGKMLISFNDIKGMETTKKEIMFAVSQLKHIDEIEKLGAKPCKGIMLYGPPGNGKTMIAKAVAKESGVPFISASGSDFIEMFVGLGASRVRHLWRLAEANAPCVVFIDEIDALGTRKSLRGGGSTSENNQTINALLQRMDGLGDTSGILVIGATNLIENLDPALLRTGRFDKKLYIGNTTSHSDRREIVEHYLSSKKLSSDVDIDIVTDMMWGLSGSDIATSINDAVLKSVEHGRNGVISISDIDESVVKCRLNGVERGCSSENDRRITAIHEAGHVLLSVLRGYEVAQVSIKSYTSGVGGYTIRKYQACADDMLWSESRFKAEIDILLAGMCAEDICLGGHTNGCSNDIEKATQYVCDMINKYGMLWIDLINESKMIESGLMPGISDDRLGRMKYTFRERRDRVRYDIEKHRNVLNDIVDKLLKDEVLYDIDMEYLGIDVNNERR